MSKGVLYILVSVVFFSATHASVKALSHIPFYELVFFRALISVWMCLIALKVQNIPIFGCKKSLLIARGLAGTLALCGYFYTLQKLPLASAVTIQYLAPIFTIAIASIFLDEKTSIRQWMFFLLAFIGVVLVKGVDQRVDVPTFLIGIGAAIGSGIAYNLVRALRTTEHPLVIVFYFPMVTIPIVLPFLIYNWVMPTLADVPLIIVIGVCTQVAQVYMTKAYQTEKASKISIYNYLGLIIAILMGYFYFNEPIEGIAATGMLLIFVAIGLNTKFGQEELGLKQT